MKKKRPAQTPEQIGQQTLWGLVIGMAFMLCSFMFTILKMSATTSAAPIWIMLVCLVIALVAAIRIWQLR